MILVLCRYDVKNGALDALLKEMKEQKLEERFAGIPGCISFQYFTPIDGQNILMLVDKWEDEEKFTAHISTDTAKAFAAVKEKYITNTVFEKYEV